MVEATINDSEIRELLKPYSKAITRSAWLNILNSFIPFLFSYSLMVWSLKYSYFLTILLVLPTAGFLFRIFEIQHNCGHNAYFNAPWANETLGCICSIFTLTPYHWWLRSHAYHHANIANLDCQETGYLTTLTVREYLQLDFWQRLKYRLYRHPLILFLVGPILKFVILQRLPYQVSPDWKKERWGIYITNCALVTFAIGLAKIIGWKALLTVHITLIMVAASWGIWLFTVQHTFDDAYMARGDAWNYVDAILQGSSHYDLPKILQWFIFDASYHHIHHLNSRIPSYRLAECFREIPVFRSVRKLSLQDSGLCMNLALWDEDKRRLVSFQDIQCL